MMILRPYQSESITLLREGFKIHQRQVLCLPTGAGKTVVFSEMVRMAAEKFTKTLVLTDRTELFKQTLKALGKTGTTLDFISPDRKGDIHGDSTTYVGMVETLKRRAGKTVHIDPDLIIIDEAHKGNFTKILDMYPEAKVIGATATPVGPHFHKYYTNIVQNIDIPELLEQDFLSPCRAYQMEQDLSDLRIKSGEYTDASLTQHYNDQKLFDGIIDEWKLKAEWKKTLVFNCNIKHAENTTAAFNAVGIPSMCITSKTEKSERNNILRLFAAGAFPVLNNCGILTTGYDEPSIECIVMNRATKSLPLWLQCCGRGSRLYPGKSEFIVLDFGMNHKQHGMWSSPRHWTLDPPKKKRETLDVAPVKDCPKCEAIVAAQAKICPFCGHKFPIKPKVNLNGIMVEVCSPELKEATRSDCMDAARGASVELQAQMAKDKLISPYWVLHNMTNKEKATKFVQEMGYKPSFIYYNQDRFKVFKDAEAPERE